MSEPLCKGKTGMFVFEDEDRPKNAQRVQDCKAICAGCPFRDPCLSNELKAMRQGADTTGVVGGTTPKERRAMLRREGATRGPAPGHTHRGEGPRRKGTTKHGTVTGHQWHVRNRVPQCDACSLAKRLARREEKRLARDLKRLDPSVMWELRARAVELSRCLRAELVDVAA